MGGYGAIIDDRLMGALSPHFGETCTVQRLEEGVDEYGQVVSVWVDRYSAIPCVCTPTKGREIRRPDQTYVVANYSIALQGHYPDIEESDRAVVGGTAYNILLVQSFAGAPTKLSCEVVR